METFDPDKALASLMDALARPGIAIHRPYPPPTTPIGRSKLGGLPTLPPGLEWPHGRCPDYGSARGRVPLHFMAQIDCSELPRIDRPGAWPALPDTGMLFFFANMHVCPDWSFPPDDYQRVLYAPHVAPDQAPRQPPAGLPVICDEVPGGFADAHGPDDPLTHRVYFEWPVRFAVIDTYPAAAAACTTPAWAELDAAHPELGLLDCYGDARDDRMRRNLYAALAIEQPSRSDPSSHKLWQSLKTSAGAPFPPIAAFGAEFAAAIHLSIHKTIDDALQRRS